MHTAFVGAADFYDLDGAVNTDFATPVFAGLATGLLYKATSGPRGAILSGIIGTGLSCAYYVINPFIFNTLLGKGGKR